MQIYFLCAVRLSFYSCKNEFSEASLRFFCPGEAAIVEDELEEDAEMMTLYFPEEDAYADVSRFSFMCKGCGDPQNN